MTELDEMKGEDRVEGLSQLARRARPQRDLWPGIESRLAPRRRSRWPVLQFALAASLVAGLAGIFSLQLARAPHGLPAAVAEDTAFASVGTLAPHSRAIVKANLAIVRSAEQQLRHALEQEPDSPGLQSLLASTENRGRALRALL
jgi:hypothetical protein